MNVVAPLAGHRVQMENVVPNLSGLRFAAIGNALPEQFFEHKNPNESIERDMYAMSLVRFDDLRIAGLMDAIALARKLPVDGNQSITIVGTGPRLREFRHAVSVSSLDNVIKLPGPTADVVSLVSRAKFVIDFSYHHSFGMTAVEAVMLGAVPLMRDGWAAREILPDDFLRWSSVDELFEKLVHLSQLDLTPVVHRLQEYVQDKYEPITVAGNFLEFLEECRTRQNPNIVDAATEQGRQSFGGHSKVAF
jgi:hypothetical protein